MTVCPRCGSFIDAGEPYCPECSCILGSGDVEDAHDCDRNELEDILEEYGYDLSDFDNGLIDEDFLEEILDRI